jgi:hypothetical protein
MPVYQLCERQSAIAFLERAEAPGLRIATAADSFARAPDGTIRALHENLRPLPRGSDGPSAPNVHRWSTVSSSAWDDTDLHVGAGQIDNETVKLEHVRNGNINDVRVEHVRLDEASTDGLRSERVGDGELYPSLANFF